MPVSHIRRPRLGELAAPWPRSPSYGMTALASEPRSVRMPLPPAPGAPFTPPMVGFCKRAPASPPPQERPPARPEAPGAQWCPVNAAFLSCCEIFPGKSDSSSRLSGKHNQRISNGFPRTRRGTSLHFPMRRKKNQ